MRNRQVALKTFIAAAACLVAFLSCATVSTVSRSYSFNERYKGVNLSDRKLLVVFPDERHVIIHNKDDVKDDFGGINATPESRIRKFYFPEVYRTISSLASGDSVFLFDQYLPDVSWGTICRNEVTLRTGSDSSGIPYAVPEKSRMAEVGLENSSVIIFEEFEFTRNKFHIEYYWDDRSRKPANLEARAKILIWDYKDDAPVFYGDVWEQVEFQFGLQRKHWEESARDLAKRIVMTAGCL